MAKSTRKDKLMGAMVKEFVKKYPDLTDDTTIQTLSELDDYGTVEQILKAYKLNKGGEKINSRNIESYLKLGEMARTKYKNRFLSEKIGKVFAKIAYENVGKYSNDDGTFRRFASQPHEVYKTAIDYYHLTERFASGMENEDFQKLYKMLIGHVTKQVRYGVFYDTGSLIGVKTRFFEGEKETHKLGIKRFYKAVVKVPFIRITKNAEGNVVMQYGFEAETVPTKDSDGRLKHPSYHTIHYFAGKAVPDPVSKTTEIVMDRFYISNKEFFGKLYYVEAIYAPRMDFIRKLAAEKGHQTPER